MKKLLYILFALLALCACEPVDIAPGGSGSGSIYDLKYKVYEGLSYNLVYTVRGDGVYEGYSYNRVYTIRGEAIYYGLSVPGIVLQIHSSPELTRSGFAGVHKFRIVAQYHSPSNP